MPELTPGQLKKLRHLTVVSLATKSKVPACILAQCATRLWHHSSYFSSQCISESAICQMQIIWKQLYIVFLNCNQTAVSLCLTELFDVAVYSLLHPFGRAGHTECKELRGEYVLFVFLHGF